MPLSFDELMSATKRAPRVPVTAVPVSAAPVTPKAVVAVKVPEPEPIEVEPVEEFTGTAEDVSPDDAPAPVRASKSPRHLHGKTYKVSPRGRTHTVTGSERDRDIIDFLALYRVAGVRHITKALSANTYTRTYAGQLQPVRVTGDSIETRLYALRSAGLVERWLQGFGQQAVWGITNHGMAASRLNLTPSVKLGPPSPVTLAHSLAMTGVAACVVSGTKTSEWGLTGDELLIPDYLIRRAAAQAIKGGDGLPQWVDGLSDDDVLITPEYLTAPAVAGTTGYHVPDLACLREGLRPLAIEVELNVKPRGELDEALVSYAHSQFDILYLTHKQRIATAVNRVWARVSQETGTHASLTVAPLDPTYLTTNKTTNNK